MIKHEHTASLFVRCEHCLTFGTPLGEPFTEVYCGNCNNKTSRWYVPFCCVENYNTELKEELSDLFYEAARKLGW